MRQQKAIVMVSGPLTPINGPSPAKSGIQQTSVILAFLRLRADCAPRVPRPLKRGRIKKAVLPQVGGVVASPAANDCTIRFPADGGPRAPWTIHSGRTPTAAFGRRRHHNRSRSRRCRPTRPPPAGRTNGQIPWVPGPRITRCRLSPLYPKPSGAAMPRGGAANKARQPDGAAAEAPLASARMTFWPATAGPGEKRARRAPSFMGGSERAVDTWSPSR
jgi:hypothetical protein